MAIIIALLAIIASCLLFGPHATLILIVLYVLVSLIVMTVRVVRERCRDAASRRAYWRQVNQVYVERLRARYVEPPKAPARPMTKKDRLITWIAALAIPGIFVLTWLGQSVR